MSLLPQSSPVVDLPLERPAPPAAAGLSALRWAAPLLWTALAVGTVLRLWIKTPTDLWEDEIIATTHAVQPFWAVIIDTLRYDIHPPLYFLQLHFWSLLNHSDPWFMANSIAWSLGALFSIWWVTKWHHGPNAALAAAAFYAASPTAVYMADQVRMYAMLAVLAIWSYHLVLLVFQNGQRRRTAVAALILLQIAIVLTHALGAFVVGLNGLFALAVVWNGKSGLKTWLVCFGISAAVALPWVLNAGLHDGNIAGLWTLRAVLLACGTAVAGPLAEQNDAVLGFGLAIFAFVAATGLRRKESVPLLAYFVLLPLLIAIIAGLFLKPFLKWNFFATISAPYLAMVLGIASVRSRKALQFGAAFCLIALLSISLLTKATFRESSRFREAAQFLRKNYRSQDVILIPQYAYFRGLAWYLDGPDWGDPLAVAPRPSPSWQHLFAYLGPKLVARLGVMPKSQFLTGQRFLLVAGTSAAPLHPDRIWTVTTPRADLPAGFPPPSLQGMQRKVAWSDGARISLYAPRASTSSPAVQP